MRLPVIDLGQESAARVAQQLRRAAETTGFFFVINHGVPKEVIDRVYTCMRDFFALPEDVKKEVHLSKGKGVRGYIGLYEQGNYGLDASDKREDDAGHGLLDAKEVFAIGQGLPESHPFYNDTLYAPNLWPMETGDGMQGFRDAVTQYFDAVTELSQRMWSLFALSLGLPADYFDAHTLETPMSAMNMTHYPPLPPDAHPSQMGIGEHTDYECFTLLTTDSVPGLQIYDGGQWSDVSPMEGAFIVNIGDMLARWTNDLFRSTVHRAVNRTSRDRYSIAYFVGCNYDSLLEPLVPGRPAKYEVVRAGDHAIERRIGAIPARQDPSEA